MPIFMSSFSYTADAWQKLCKHPEDRSVPIAALAQKLGGKLLSMYYMAGDYDGVVIFEAPDAKAAATFSIAAELAGHVKTLKTLQLYTVAEAMEAMGNAGKLTLPPPKG